jgi:hypothetical protein
MHQIAGTMHGWHLQFTNSCSVTSQMGSTSFQIPLSPMDQQTLMVELLHQWRVVRYLREHKLQLTRNICLTVKLSHIGRQLNGACNPFKAHLDGYDYLFQLTMISNGQTFWKFASDFIIYAFKESDGTRFNLYTSLNGERQQKKKKYGLIFSSVWRSSSVRFLDLDQVQPQLQPQPVRTAPSIPFNWTELYTTSPHWSGCCTPTNLNRSYTRLVETSRDRLGTQSQPVFQ